MKILFDNVELEGDYVMSLTQQGKLFSETFKLGSTVCRIMSLRVSKAGIENMSYEIDIDSGGVYVSSDLEETGYYGGQDNNGIYVSEDSSDSYNFIIDNEGVYATLSYQANELQILDDEDNQQFKGYLDEYSKNNEHYYEYVFADSMIRLNVPLSEIFDWVEGTDYTVQNIADKVCDYIESAHFTVEYLGGMVMNWSFDISAREFLSYIAEIAGGFARINNSGNVEIVKFKSESRQSIDVEICKDFSLGEQHSITRVGFNAGVASYYYPADSSAGNTVYINEDNVLLTDSGSFTIENTIRHIYEEIGDFNFYPITTSKCTIDDSVLPGDIVTFVNGDKSYPTIAQIDWNYISGWKGGYDLKISTEVQEETYINYLYNRIRNIKITVDRELNEITQQILDAEANIQLVAGNVIKNVDVMYGQSIITNPPTVPQAWETIAPAWNDNLHMWEKTVTTYMDTREVSSEPSLVEKVTGKTVYSVSELYYCSNSDTVPDKPDSHITSTDNVYNQWTKHCPTTNSEYTFYYTCSEIYYSDGTYSWTDVKFISSYYSAERVSEEVITVQSNISTVNQKADSIELSVQEISETTIPNLETRTQTLETCVSIQTEGVRISQGSLGAYTLLTDEGMEIYAEGNKVAYALKDGFYAMDYIMNGWHMVTANNNNSFCFVRKEYNA